MPANLLRSTWSQLDTDELQILLAERIGGPGQYNDRAANPNRFYLPLAGAQCRVVLTFEEQRVINIEPGEAFDNKQWNEIAEEIENSILKGPIRIGRDYSFSSYRVHGSWHGVRSGVQILPPHPEAPQAEVELAEHPFILEFSVRDSGLWPLTNHRRMREHRKLTLLLNTLLAGRTNLQSRRSDHFWGRVLREDGGSDIRWVQNAYDAPLGPCMLDVLSPPAAEVLHEIAADQYFTMVRGVDGLGLRVPADLDDSICRYLNLAPARQAEFDRAAFWLDNASRCWNDSMSASFAFLVSAVEALINKDGNGSTKRFRDFFETYAPGETLAPRRNTMYNARSRILHGSALMTIDKDAAFGWSPPWSNEQDLYSELWSVTRTAMRNWLRNPPPI